MCLCTLYIERRVICVLLKQLIFPKRLSHLIESLALSLIHSLPLFSHHFFYRRLLEFFFVFYVLMFRFFHSFMSDLQADRDRLFKMKRSFFGSGFFLFFSSVLWEFSHFLFSISKAHEGHKVARWMCQSRKNWLAVKRTNAFKTGRL